MVTLKSLWLPAHPLALIAAIFASGYGFGQAREPLIAVQALFATSKTVVDEPMAAGLAGLRKEGHCQAGGRC